MSANSVSSEVLSPRIALEASPRAPVEALVPRNAAWWYIVSPPFLALVLSPGLLELGAGNMARSIASTWIHTVAIGSSLHGLYAWVVPRVLERQTSRLPRALIHTVAVVSAVLVGFALSKPFVALLCNGRQREAWWELYTSLVISTCFVAAMVSYQALRRHAREVEQRAQLERQAALSAELESLQARTNPHFLFNALNTVAGLIGEDPVRAERAVERLSSIFRYTLEASRRTRVPLRDEMEAVRHYLELEALRYEDRLVYEVTVAPEVANTPVVALLIQPLVENAVRHGVEGRGSGNVCVRAELAGDEVVISVTDDGPGHGNSGHVGTGTSLRELRKRLELAFGGTARLSIGRADSGGCSVELRLPRTT